MKKYLFTALVFMAVSSAAFADNYVMAGLGRFTLPQNNAHADNAAGTAMTFTLGRSMSSNFDLEAEYAVLMNSEFTAPGAWMEPATATSPAVAHSTYTYTVSGHALTLSTVGHLRMCDSCGASLIAKLGVAETSLSIATNPYIAPPIPLSSSKFSLNGGVGMQYETSGSIFRLMLNEYDAGSPYRIKNTVLSYGTKF